MAGSGTDVLMADGTKETPAAVRGRTWHRGGSDWEQEARGNQGLTARDYGSGGGGPGRFDSGSGLLRQVWLRQRATQACDDDVG